MVLGEQCDRISVLGLHSEVMVLSLHWFCSTCTSTTCLADQLWFVTHIREEEDSEVCLCLILIFAVSSSDLRTGTDMIISGWVCTGGGFRFRCSSTVI